MVRYGVKYKMKTVTKAKEVSSKSPIFWEHAVNEPVFEYVVDSQNAKLVADIMKKLHGHVSVELMEVKKIE